MQLTDAMRKEYVHLFETCVVKPIGLKYSVPKVTEILAHRAQYEAVEKETGVPWFFIACAHYREAGLSWDGHLHNGDSLSARTRRVPSGLPKHDPHGEPIIKNGKQVGRKFTWHESAVDALRHQDLLTWKDWSLPGVLFQLERFNGFGYRSKGVNAPYLFSMTSAYEKGYFVRDHVFDPNAVNKQMGVVCLLKEMQKRGVLPPGLVAPPEPPSIDKLKILAASVKYNLFGKQNAAIDLQHYLNRFPNINIAVDGYAGTQTSNVVHSLTGQYLNGDPRRL